MSMSQIVMQQNWRRRLAAAIRYGVDLSTPPPTEDPEWNPTQLIRNAERRRQADDPGIVDFESVYRVGDTDAAGSIDLQSIVNRVPPGPTGHTLRQLSFPEGEFVMDDYLNGNFNGVYIGGTAGANVLGFHGSGGDKTVFRPKANSATRFAGNADAKAPGKRVSGTLIAFANRPGVRCDNFGIRGNPMTLDGNDLYYSGIAFKDCPGGDVSGLYLRGASRGYRNSPPGETFGINVRSDNFTVHDLEVDGRNDAGERWCASPIGWNGAEGSLATGGAIPNRGTTSTFAKNARLLRVYCHHGYTSMITWWLTENIYSEDIWSFSTASGQGGLSGSALNHEMYRGPVTHIRPKLFPWSTASGNMVPPYPLPNDPKTDNTAGFHVAFATSVVDPGQIQILYPVFDRAAGGTGMFAFVARDTYGKTWPEALPQPQTIFDGPAPQIVLPSDVQLTPKHHPLSGWNSSDPTKFYSWIH